MASFTAPNGSTVSIPGSAVVRIRDAYPEESTEANARCRIDHPSVQFVTDESGAVVPAVKAENTQIGRLTLPNDKPVWFAGPVSRGPIRLVSGHPPTARSALYIIDKIQYVTETPEGVRNAVAAGWWHSSANPLRGLLCNDCEHVQQIQFAARGVGLTLTPATLVELTGALGRQL